MANQNFKQAISNLSDWLETWRADDGGIHGYVVHHHAEAMSVISPDSWTMGAALLAHLNLHEKTQEKRWFDLGKKDADYLVNNYVREKSIYKNSCFEHKPGKQNVYTSLIHNAYPSYALLKYYKKSKDRKALETARDNIHNYIIKKCWDPEKNFFTRGVENDKVSVLNMASVAAGAIILLDEIEEKNEFTGKFCKPAIYKIIEAQRGSGSFPYDDAGKNEPLIYTAITMKGIFELYEKTREKKLFDSLRNAANFLLENVDGESGFFIHRIDKERKVKYPQFIAGAMIILQEIKKLEKWGIKFEKTENVFEKIISAQHKSGGIPSFYGFSDIFMPNFYRAEPEKKKWRDVLPVPGWNALALEGMAYFIGEGEKIPPSSSVFPCKYQNNEFEIIESEDKVEFLKEGKVEAKWYKQKDIWEFGNLKLRTEEQRVKHSLAEWKRRLFFIRPILEMIGPFRNSDK